MYDPTTGITGHFQAFTDNERVLEQKWLCNQVDRSFTGCRINYEKNHSPDGNSTRENNFCWDRVDKKLSPQHPDLWWATPLSASGFGNFLHDAGKAIANAPGKALHMGLNTVGFVSYAFYYGSYKVLGWTGTGSKTGNILLDIFTPRGELVFIEAVGLGGDVGVDWIKGHTINHENIRDEGRSGPINPFHEWIPKRWRWLFSPNAWLVGVHANHKIDWHW